MKLATLKSSGRDGRLVLVSRDLRLALDVGDTAATLQQAIDHWAEVEAPLQALYQSLNEGRAPGAFVFDPVQAGAPLPRVYQWLDGSSFITHGYLMQKAFHLEPIEDVESIALIYQGAGDDFLGSRDDIPLPSEQHGIDFEGEFAVVVDEVPKIGRAHV